MPIAVDAGAIRGGALATQELSTSTGRALDYLDSHLTGFRAWGDGAAMGLVLQNHGEYCRSIEDAITGSKRLLVSTSEALTQTASDFESNEADAIATISALYRDLDPTVSTPALAGSSAHTWVESVSPSTALTPPESALADPAFEAVWSILGWPDYLSLSYWGREATNEVVNALWPGFTGGQDVFEYVAQQIGGDWDRIALAGGAFGNLGAYFALLAQGVEGAASSVFSGWSGGDGSAAAGEYFAELAAAFAAQQDTYDMLELKYTQAAWGAFGACNALLSAFDALIDAIIAALFGVESVLSAIAAVFTGGATLPESVVGAVIGVIEAFSAAWGTMMTAVSATIAVGGALGAATKQIEFIPLPDA